MSLAMDHQTATATTVQPLIRYPPSNNSLLSSGNTKKAIAYEPRTEAISPAINDDIINAEDSTSQSTKDEQTLLVEKLKKVEAEILQTELQIARLRRQKDQLEQAANSANKDDDDQENVCETKQLSIAKLVYHENRAKAQKAHSRLECLGTTRDLPIYNQPSDNSIYHQNAAKFANSFKSKLISCFRVRLQNRLKLEETVSAEYNRRMEKWLKSIELEDSQPSKRLRDAKTREFFEKQFPELKKARESGERFSRVGQRVARSDAELDELLDGITEREDQDKKVKSYAVIPPMLEEMRSRKPKFINTNGYVEDIVAEYKEYQILNTWTDEEKEIFKENYLQHPKDFGLIARMTTRKNVANCVQYYYLSKKSENYKQLLKRQQKRRTRSFVRPALATPANPAPETNGDAANGNKVTNGFNSTNENQAGDSAVNDTTGQEASNQNDNSKGGHAMEEEDKRLSNSDVHMTADGNNRANLSCCICNCNFGDSNQFRNVTRSNHQLYGISLDTLKPGMKICYPCRFRHVKHPSFDEPPANSEPMNDEDEEVETELHNTDMMDVHPSVTQTDPQPVIDNMVENKMIVTPRPISPPKDLATPEQQSSSSNSDSNIGPQRTCVRDIIYQAIEMSFQKPKATEAMDVTPKAEPVRPECTPINLVLPKVPLSNSLPPLQQLGRNHLIPNTLPTHLPVQNMSLDHQHQLQLEMQQRHRQQLMESNLKQHQCAPINPVLPKIPLSNSLQPLQQIGPNHLIPNTLPAHLPGQNTSLGHQHHLQLEMQQRHRQQLLESNLKQHQCAPINPVLPQLPLSNSLAPLQPIGPNHLISNTLPAHLSGQNMSLDHQHQLQLEVQQRHRQQLMEYNLKQHQLQSPQPTREDSRSPSEMVIDETVDAQSPPAASDQEEGAK